MGKNILVVRGGGRPGGNTAQLAESFAKGAVEAAKFLKGKPAGHYDMADVIAAK